MSSNIRQPLRNINNIEPINIGNGRYLRQRSLRGIVIIAVCLLTGYLKKLKFVRVV